MMVGPKYTSYSQANAQGYACKGRGPTNCFALYARNCDEMGSDYI